MARVTRRPPDRDRIVKVKEGLTEEESFALEKLLISFWGRIDTGTGVLRNLTDGGDGVSGLHEEGRRKIAENTSRCLKGRKGHGKGKVVTTETRKKLSEVGKGKKRSVESCKKQSETMKGRKRPPEVVAKIRKTLMGHKLSEETKEKIRQSHLRRSRGT